MRNIGDETIGSLFRPIKDWIVDSTTRIDSRTTKELRETLYSIVKGKSNDGVIKFVAQGEDEHLLAEIQVRAEIGLSHCRNKIETFDKATLAAIITASSHPDYDTAGSIRESHLVTRTIRDIAVYFDTLHSSGIGRRLYPVALHCLSTMNVGDEDIHRLHNDSPEAANALLRIAIHFMTNGTSVGVMKPEIRKIIKDSPQTADDLISFSRSRMLTCANDIDPDGFRAVLESSTASLRDGVL